MNLASARPVFAVLATTILIACSGGGTGTPGGGPGGGVEIDASRIFKGTVTVSGTITLPSGSGAGKLIQLTASGGGADITQRGSYVGLAGSTPGETVPYRITGLVAGKYSVRARIDQNGDGRLDSPGDLDGFTGGSVEAPIQDFAAAKEVTVGASGATAVDFGVGPIR